MPGATRVKLESVVTQRGANKAEKLTIKLKNKYLCIPLAFEKLPLKQAVGRVVQRRGVKVAFVILSESVRSAMALAGWTDSDRMTKKYYRTTAIFLTNTSFSTKTKTV
jgi:hypothetical protein